MGKGKTIVISTHLLDEAQSIANRIILINKGKIDYYKGAYNIKSVLLKGGACNE